MFIWYCDSNGTKSQSFPFLRFRTLFDYNGTVIAQSKSIYGRRRLLGCYGYDGYGSSSSSSSSETPSSQYLIADVERGRMYVLAVSGTTEGSFLMSISRPRDGYGCWFGHKAPRFFLILGDGAFFMLSLDILFLAIWGWRWDWWDTARRTQNCGALFALFFELAAVLFGTWIEKKM